MAPASLPKIGEVEKQSEWGFWQVRHLEVGMGYMKYFKEGCAAPRGMLRSGDVLGFCVEKPSTIILQAKLTSAVRIYRFRVSSTEEAKAWSEAIRLAFGSISSMSVRERSWSSFLVERVSECTPKAVSQMAAAADKEEWVPYLEEKLHRAKTMKNQWEEQLGLHMEEALTTCDESTMNMLLDKAFSLSAQYKESLPRPVRQAARQVAGRKLREATEFGDPKCLKGALVAAKRLQCTDLPEFAAAAAKYLEVRRLPQGWDVARMVEERQLGAERLVARPDRSSDKSLLALVQLMFDRTFRRISTRDRHGQPVPLGLEVVSVHEVQNESQWLDYRVRLDEIREDTRASRELVPNFLPYEAETDIPLAEAQALAAVESRVKVSHGASPGEKHEVRSPVSGQPIQITLSAESLNSRSTDGLLLRGSLASGLPGQELDPAVNEAWLFHGTKPIAADKITRNDFKIDMAGSSAGTLYGRGIYLAENSTKADEYADPDPRTGLSTLLLCRAALGRVLYTAEVDPDPRQCEDACLRGNFHSVLGDRRACRGTFREFVVFDEESVYPSFIVTYRRIMPAR